MAAHIIHYTSMFSTVLTAIVSVIAILIVREHKILFVVTCIFYAIMVMLEFENGRIENAIVEVVMDLILIAIALKPWRREV